MEGKLRFRAFPAPGHGLSNEVPLLWKQSCEPGQIPGWANASKDAKDGNNVQAFSDMQLEEEADFSETFGAKEYIGASYSSKESTWKHIRGVAWLVCGVCKDPLGLCDGDYFIGMWRVAIIYGWH